MQFFTSFYLKFVDIFITRGMYKMVLSGLKNTAVITLGALAIGVAIGMVIAIVKYFADDSKALKPLAWLCDVYTTVVRGIPMVVLLMIFYYIILVSAEGITVGIIAFGINSGAYMAELIRSGINAVDRGQMEAGRSLGMSKLQTMRKIILPQAVRYILPAIGNEMIALVKETSVAGYVAVAEVTRSIFLIRNNTYESVVTLTLLAAIYLVIVIILTRLLKLLERRLSNNAKRRKS
ncbi:MAG: amino acid ABC transporter permease [Clostridia bacterium]|jgi:polar amino acid transport system permease protein|nr:amino acid ABC transporter permease [Clostridia bacterium]